MRRNSSVLSLLLNVFKTSSTLMKYQVLSSVYRQKHPDIRFFRDFFKTTNFTEPETIANSEEINY